MTNKIRSVFYIGVTNNLERRILENINPIAKTFTQKYKCFYLVYYETHPTALSAIAREKQMKKWKREWKVNLIQEMNPLFDDLSENVIRFQRFLPPQE